MTQTHVDIRLPKTSTRGFLSLLPSHLTQHEPIITNLRAAVDYTYPSERTQLPALQDLLSLSRTEASRKSAADIHFLSELFFENYQSYETINQWLYLLESLRPELVQVINIGESHEGREILGLIIKGTTPKKYHPKGTVEGAEERPVPGMVMHGAQHAREWISVSTVCYIAYQMVAGYYVDESVRKIVDEFEWTYFSVPVPFCFSFTLRSPINLFSFILALFCCILYFWTHSSFVPILNVDGYEYSWTTDRLWRKNRQPTPVPFCTGIDPDRSWGYMWDAPGSEIFSSNP